MIKQADPDLQALIAGLGSDHEVRRETAIARLMILGERALPRLVAAFESAATRHMQTSILRVLEGIEDARAVALARQALALGGDVALAAVAVLREAGARRDSSEAQALDALFTAARDASADRRVRFAAAEAIDAVCVELGGAARAALQNWMSEGQALWADAADGRLPDDPGALRRAIAEYAGSAPLPELHRIIKAVRTREQATAAGTPAAVEHRREWCAVRGAIHQALALRGSRVALYDLRETVEVTAEPLPPSFVAALHLVGDSSCLEPLAAAFTRAGARHEHWQHQLAQAFHVIVRRERISRRQGAMRRALARAPGLGANGGLSP